MLLAVDYHEAAYFVVVSGSFLDGGVVVRIFSRGIYRFLAVTAVTLGGAENFHSVESALRFCCTR